MSTTQDSKKTTGTYKRSRVSRGGKQQNTASRGSGGAEPRKGYKKNSNFDENSPSITTTTTTIKQQIEEIPEDEQCIICAERIKYAALTPCNHTTCHKCTFRQRSLYERNTCLICRSENDKIIITELIDKDYDEISADQITGFDEKYRIEFTQDYVQKDTLALLENTCSICRQQQTFPEFKQLIDHAKEIHGKYYCLICSKFKKAFIPELPLYSYKQLQRHQSEGDGNGNGTGTGNDTETGFKGHPECKHCHGKRFYSEDELNVHIRDRHERCHICDQSNPKTADYYKNYDTLYIHFTKAHYVCSVASCIEKRFVVFRDDLDLTAHMLKEHGGLNNGQRVVIGSNSYHQHSGHFSQLSTFNNSRWLSSNEDQDEDQQSPEIKKRRFEERAKHYLNYDNAKYQEFTKINELFSKKKINASELLSLYQKDLFIHQSLEDLNFLFKEFLEFFPKTSDLYKDLLTLVVEENENNPTEQFPVLGGSNAANAFTSNGWIGGGGSGSAAGSSRNSGASTPVDRFPPLKKPEKVKYVNPNEQPIRYSTVLKKSKPKAVSVNRSPFIMSPAPYLPNYLDRINNTKSDTSLTNGSKSSTQAFKPPALHNAGAAALDDNKFPALEKKSVKKMIPRVNEVKVTEPSSWGKPGASSNGSTKVTIPDDTSGIEIVDKRKQKMKKKQDRILFSNAF